MKDFLGRTLQVGDYVAFAYGSGHYRQLVLRRVTVVDPDFVKLDGLRAQPIYDPSRLVVVEPDAVPADEQIALTTK